MAKQLLLSVKTKYQRIRKLLSEFILENKYAGPAIGLIAALLIFSISFTEFYKKQELRFYDLRFTLKPSVDVWDKLVFADIDENSLTAVGLYPWPRDVHSKALKNMKTLQTRLTIFDITFFDQSPNRVSVKNYYKALKKVKNNQKISEKELNSIVKDNDILFGKALKENGSVILAYQFNPAPLSSEQSSRHKSKKYKKAIKSFEKKCSIKIPKNKKNLYMALKDKNFVSVNYPIPEVMNNALSFGFTNREPDADGGLRKIRLVANYNGRLYFNLSMITLIKTCAVQLKNIDIIPGKHIILKKAWHPIKLGWTDIKIPIDRNGVIHVNWASKGKGKGNRGDSYKLIPYSHLLEYDTKISQDVHDFFDEDIESTQKRSKLNEKNLTLFQEFQRAKTAEKRREIYSKIKKNISKIQNLYKKSMKTFAANIKTLEKDYKQKPTNIIKNRINRMKGDLLMIDIIIKSESLGESIILTGLTAAGTIDFGITPLNNNYPRVGIYHNTINTILQDSFITEIPWYFNFLLIFFVSVGLTFLVQREDARKSILIISGAFIAVNLTAILLFVLGQILIDQLGIILASIVPTILVVGVKFVNEESQKRYIKNAFSRYLAPGVIDQIIDDPHALQLGGDNRIITIFFSDIVKFSTISENLTPPELVSLLNEYLSEMTNIIIDHGGTVDKYIGDAIMAFFGAPHTFEDHAIKCCLATIDMKKKLKDLQDKWKAEGKTHINARIGINTGQSVVGNMGSGLRMDYTAMGDAVNLASRLEGANKHYNTNTIISQTTYEAAKGYIEARRLDLIRVVGKTEPILIYELLNKKGQLNDRMNLMLEEYYQGLEFFEKHQWKKAISFFEKALEIVPDDGPSSTYIDRCKHYMKNPPSKKWDGVYTFKTK